MKKTTVIVLFIIVLLIPSLGQANDIQGSGNYDDILEPVMARAKIIDMLYENEGDYGFVHQVFVAEIVAGPFKGETVLVENAFSGNPAMDMIIHPGDKVILAMEVIDNQIAAAYPQDFYREFHIYLLIGIFILVLLAVGQLKGLKAIFTLGITVFLIAKVMLPAMLKGYDPLMLAIIISVVVTTITLVIIGGLTPKTFAAILGTTGGVLVAAFISLWVGHAAKLTGLSGQEAQMLMYIADSVGFNFKNLLFAGIIIGALGAVMDVSMSIASAMDEIKLNNPSISKARLIQSGMNVGKDIMGTMTNTLILAYTGTSIPLLLLFLAYQQSYLKIVNMDFIATEFVRALSGSIGLVFAIPITALVSAALTRASSSRKKSKDISA
ncbi:YibE/F family protein [Desulfitibacter alkalitolerans]|uniref:YibE/F family protein n=1 Tax=Desulfitibacter alkalitolerans TaxID=264641 RepID=UPI0004872E3A|nr:YibE/F family protein [Desulfitibacter alkalitolerans]